MTNEEINDRLKFYIKRLIRVRGFEMLDSGLLRIDGDFTVEQLTDLIGVLIDSQQLQ